MKRPRAIIIIHEYHAGIFGELVAKHEPKLLTLRGIRNLYVERLTTELNARALICARAKCCRSEQQSDESRYRKLAMHLQSVFPGFWRPKDNGLSGKQLAKPRSVRVCMITRFVVFIFALPQQVVARHFL